MFKSPLRRHRGSILADSHVPQISPRLRAVTKTSTIEGYHSLRGLHSPLVSLCLRHLAVEGTGKRGRQARILGAIRSLLGGVEKIDVSLPAWARVNDGGKVAGKVVGVALI